MSTRDIPASGATPGPGGPTPPGKKLDSWGEIASYLGREVRTVQRWERTESLPVHRHEDKKKTTVYAYEARAAIQKLQQQAATRFVPNLYPAAIHLGLGEKDEGFRLLNLAFQEKIDRLVYLNVDPMADPLRSDPRFAQLMAKVGFHQTAH